MKKIGRIISITAVVLVVALCAIAVTACGTQTGSYEGTYSYKSGAATITSTVTFTVGDDGMIWDTVITNTSSDPSVAAPGIGQRPWDGTKVTGKIDGNWAPSEIEDIVVEVDENGVPSGKITADREFPTNLGYEVGVAAAVLAMQNALEAGPVAE